MSLTAERVLDNLKMALDNELTLRSALIDTVRTLIDVSQKLGEKYGRIEEYETLIAMADQSLNVLSGLNSHDLG